MLKWTILTRRDSQVDSKACNRLSLNFPSTESLPHTPRQKGKRRRSSTSRRASAQKRCSLDALEADKENQFHSTPIKNNSLVEAFSPFKDVSNLTPSKEQFRRVQESPKMKIKKKKECLESHYLPKISNETNYFKPFEAVDSHIESILAEDLCRCNKKKSKEPLVATTPKIFAFGIASGCKPTKKREDTPPSKKSKVEYIDALVGATEKVSLPGYKVNLQKKNMLDDEVRVSPLVRKFLDLKFNNVSNVDMKANNSSFINDLSLDRLVDVLIDNSRSDKNTDNMLLNTSMVVNVDNIDLEKENDHNETKEDNILNAEQERQSEVVSEASSDSGFKSSTNENSHQLDSNYLCKCNNNNLNYLEEDNTIIEVDNTYNERCVDVEFSRKRSSFTTEETDVAKRTKIDDSCNLKRQRCIRKRKVEHFRKKLSRINSTLANSETVSPFWSTQKQFPISDEDSFSFPSNGFEIENTPLRGCYLENKEILVTPLPTVNVNRKSSTKMKTPMAPLSLESKSVKTPFVDTPSDTNRTIRKCLKFDSPKVSDSSSFADSTVRSAVLDIRGSVDLRIFSSGDNIYVNVIRCHDLYRGEGETINAYVKVAISDSLHSSRNKKKNAVLQRTPVQSDSSRPIFNHTFKFSKLPASDGKKRIHVEVWHRDRAMMSSEFLGCISFGVEDVCNKVIEGSYRLLPQLEGRISNALLINDLNPHESQLVNDMGENNQEGCCGSESVIEEIVSLDGVETELKRSTNKAILTEQQKYADEHLFLRYLELDPLEGPEAIPAAMQRKATGNKFGRTPFTQTKRLTRPAKSGFGFSVVWTHPPRIERVERGLPAEKAGILPGDYIIFVDKQNVVMMPEIDILNLIRSYGSQLTLEIFRKNPSRNGSVPSVHQKSATIVTPSSLKTDSNVNLPSSTTVGATLRRPSTVCSTNTASVDYRRRKLNLPQVTFSSEKPTSSPEESRNRAIYQLIGKEQQYATALQFAITRFVSALAERRDLLSPAEHKALFQNCDELLRITEDILDHLVHEDGEMDTSMVTKIYRCKLHEITSCYKKYCSGIKRADCVLANKMKNCNSDFVRFVQCPAIPRRRPDLTTFIHKPLEHYREILKLLMSIQGHTPAKHEDFPVINQIVHEMQVSYREITSEGGLMEPCGEGRPLLSVQDLENRLVFTKCKPFVLNKPGRQWIFGGDLSRVEGRNVRQYWTLLFSDLLLFAKASRDRVLFISEDPLPLVHITDMYFNIRKKDTEFRISINSDIKKQATSPTIHCGPDLSKMPRKNANKKTVILRAPSTELKAVWQNLLQRQIFQLNSGMDGSSLSSPMDSPEVPINSSVGTLQSVETSSYRRQPQHLANESRQNNNDISETSYAKKQIETLIEHKCKQMGKSSFNGKCNAVHLEQWMKGQLDVDDLNSPVVEHIEEVWTEEMLRKRSEELQLIDCKGNVTASIESRRSESGCEEIILSDQEEHSPSKSTTTESQVTVRSSPLVPETVPVCRQCHKNCLSNVLANSKLNHHTHKDCSSNNHINSQTIPSITPTKSNENENWQQFVLLGLCTNPVSSLVKYDPFTKTELTAPSISVAPPTPENSVKSGQNSLHNEVSQNKEDCVMIDKLSTNAYEQDISPDDSPQTEEPPYHSLSSSALTLRRFGTVSSLERFESEEQDDNQTELYENHCSSDESDIDDDYLGIDNAAFNHSSILSWTAKAGSYVAEKMSFFEKLGEDYRSGGGFFDRYLKSSEDRVNGEENQEEETSGGTSGEEIWGTPTSGEDLDDTAYSPNYDGKLSPNNESYCSDTMDDTEILMDDLLMAPPITGAILRGLLPRRTLEPLIEEDFSDSTSSTSSSDPMSPQSGSSDQGSISGSAADTCSRDVVELERSEPDKAESNRNRPSSRSGSVATTTTTTTSPEEDAHKSCPPSTSGCPTNSQSLSSEWEEAQRVCEGEGGCCAVVNDVTVQPSPSMPRSDSYRKIVEAAEDAILQTTPSLDNIASKMADPLLLFGHFQPAAKFVNIERVSRTKSIRIFEFFNVRRTERRIYERYPENRQVMKMYAKEDVESVSESSSPSKISNKEQRDSRNGRFWRQLRRRRVVEKSTNPA
ncbi:uncharacterized protein LOC126734076 [Anthonomus grandis grandis]|uniref:uncharacterized protein LOC126734076 n=1 Tax=Anthonomus grandis grandis TaxID=2921223 RepID=UPI00216624D4|nr:uncharacterized protein LOC126734076 [Anthonomus grandis grandis]